MRETKSAFTLVEILIVIGLLAILAVVTFVIINPAQRINAANDTQRREEVREIQKAIEVYSTQNGGSLPTVSGNSLPVVTNANVLTLGAPASTLDGFTPVYMKAIPLDPSGSEYRVGILANQQVIVGTTLSDGNPFIIP